MNRRERRRRARLRAALALAPLLGVGGLYGLGLSLPAVQVERIEVSLVSSPETLWSVLTDLDAMPGWRQDLRGLERLPSRDGVVRWRELGRTGRAVALERIEVAPPERMVVRLAEGSEDRRWVYEITRDGANTRLAISDQRSVRNPLRRAFVRVFGRSRAVLDGWTRDLETRLSGRRQQIAGAAAGGGH
jgi:uncharacterized protein YndB with AHSA1/START domain